MSTVPSTFGTLDGLLSANRKWADNMKRGDEEYFSKLANQQTPQLLWIGCSDSRVPANQIVNLAPGEVFVHRNIANVVNHNDLNVLSVLQYAVEILKVKHVIVTGHYGCGGVAASLQNQQFGLIDNWLRTIKDIYQANEAKVEALPDQKAKVDLMCELNVANSVRNVVHTSIVQNAWARGQELSIHGWCYRLDDGIIRDLNIRISGPSQLHRIYDVISDKVAANS
ncbi:carbonic anhydrase [Blastocladiella britannica]|nr:carbonic anhydrase [Blastocladiella britannica]